MSINFDYRALSGYHKLATYAQRACSTIQGVQHTYILTRHALSVPGLLVECGVAYGGNAAVILQASLDAKDERDLHLFDSYEGIPLAGPKDGAQPGMSSFVVPRDRPLKERLKSSGISASTVDQVKGHFSEWTLPMNRVHFHKGWFQDVLPANDLGPIAMLRLDGDLYESTMCCLEWLYPKVVADGVVLVDDWPLGGTNQAVRDYFGDKLPVEMPVTVDTGACYWLK